MKKGEAIDLINQLRGDEHAWVDFKLDYEIGGLASKTAEFIKDVSSLSNTLTDQKEHYIIIGVNDDGDLEGISSDSEEYDGEGPRHIFSYDESDIQEIVDENLAKSPTISWHTFEEDGKTFGILVIKPLSDPPAVTVQDINDDYGNQVLHKGLIFVRKGSGKKIAEREDLDDLIKYRIKQQREQILDGIHKSIALGPEWIDRIGAALPDDPNVPLTTAENPDEADVEVTQRVTREPASTLDEQLNEDISQWKYRGDDFIEPKPMWEYYANPTDITHDDLALEFLTQSAIKNSQLGVFWLIKADIDTQRDIILSTPDHYHRMERAAKVLLLMNDEDCFDKLMEKCSSDPNIGELRVCKRKIGNTLRDRVRFLRESEGSYNIKHGSLNAEINPSNMGSAEIQDNIIKISNELFNIRNDFDRRDLWGKKEKFRNVIWDLEVALGAEQF